MTRERPGTGRASGRASAQPRVEPPTEGGRLLASPPRCSSCEAKLPARAKFCAQCGTAVAVAAVSAASSPPTPQPAAPARPEADPRVAYTPRHLAEKILTSRSALSGERKQVTVLFADIKGSMELAEQADPEEWHRIMDRFFAILTDGVHRFEGTVNQYTGDGVMALFGAPIAHEDHAQRACYAALELRDQLRRYGDSLRVGRGLNFSVRMGINSGEVIVGAIGDDLRMDYTALGHTVGLAARMEQIAEPGRVYVTEHTAALVKGFVELRDLGATAVKGTSAPLHVFELKAAGPLRTRFDVSRARGLSRFVGRAAEMRTLDEALADVAGGRPRVVSLVAEPGVGKSRLCYEFVEHVRTRRVPVFQCHCVAHGKAIPFLPVIELVRSLFDIGERDGAASARQKIAGAMVLIDESLRAALPLMFDFLGVPDPERPLKAASAEARQRQLFDVVRRVVLARGTAEPAVFFVDDLHWLDAGSAAFLHQLVTWLPGTQILLLTNSRPEYHSRWQAEVKGLLQRAFPSKEEKGVMARLIDLLKPARHAGEPEAQEAGAAGGAESTPPMSGAYTEIALEPLAPEASRELLEELLGTDASMAAAATQILSRTGGNPFFIEEVVRALAESGGFAGARGAYRLAAPIETITIPATVQAVLAARIDRLSEREKDVLQVVAVIGKECADSLLRAVIADCAATPGMVQCDPGEASTALVGLVAADFLYARDGSGDPVYVFAHPLTQEVAYRAQLAERRGRLHAAAARAIAQLYPDAGQRAAELAHHWEEAGEWLAAAHNHMRAAWWVAGADAAGTVEHLRQARRAVDRLPKSDEARRIALDADIGLLRVSFFVAMTAEDAAEIFAQAQALARTLGDARLEAQLLSTYAYYRSYWGALREARALARRAARLAENVDDPALQVSMAMDRSQLCLWDGDLREGLRQVETVLRLLAAKPLLFDFRGAVGLSGEAFGHGWRGLFLSLMGRLPEAKAELDTAVELARRDGGLEAVGLAASLRALAGWGVVGTEVLETDAQTAIEVGERIGTPFLRTMANFALGTVHVLRGQWADARDAIERAVVLGREGVVDGGPRVLGGSVLEGIMLPLLAYSLAAGGALDDGLAIADTAVRLAQERSARLLEGTAQLARAQVLLARGDSERRAEIEAAIETARACADETSAHSLRPLIHVTRGQLLARHGDAEGTRREFQEARRLLKKMGAVDLAAQVPALL